MCRIIQACTILVRQHLPRRMGRARAAILTTKRSEVPWVREALLLRAGSLHEVPFDRQVVAQAQRPGLDQMRQYACFVALDIDLI